MPDPILTVDGVHKAYGPVRALSSVSLQVRAGEIHAICGENGAGKSTLLKVLAGSVQPDGGTVTLRGERYAPASPVAATRAGVAIVYQERSLLPNISVAENIAIGTDAIGSGAFIDRGRMRARARELLSRLDPGQDPDVLVGELSIARQQVVEIAKALARRPAVLMLDEPTSSIGAEAAGELFALLRRLRADGLAIVYISHHLDEVFEIADTISVLRDGSSRGTWAAAELDEAELVARMVGREYSHARQARPGPNAGLPLLRVDGVVASAGAPPVTFDVRAGEIVALTGLVGAGRSELAEAIFGVRPRAAGGVTIDGRALPAQRPGTAIARGLAMLTEDRKLGLFQEMSIRENLAAPSLKALGSPTGVDERASRRLATDFIAQLGIRASSPDAPVSSLSGGNQQKVLMAMWLATRPKVLIVDEPTKGIDVGAKDDIHQILLRLAADGAGILLISSDGAEVHRLADRVLVMRRGALVAELPGGASEHEIVGYASGARAA